MMKKHRLLWLIAALLCCLTLASCGEEVEVPEGLQLCRADDALGYTMYAPEGWTVCNVGSVSAAHVSAYNKTSISLTEGRIEDVPVTDDGTATGVRDLIAYFDAQLFPYPIEIVTHGNTDLSLGNATEAASFLYTFPYDGHDYKCLQVLAVYDERLYIFTYTSFDEPYQNSDTTYYAQYYDSAKLAMDNLKFSEKSSAESKPAYEKDADGYALVSDMTTNGFALYMPDGWTCDIREGIVQVRCADGASVNLSEATGTGYGAREYFILRIKDLDALASDIVLMIDGEEVLYTADTDLTASEYKPFVTATDFADASQAAVCEYTYTFGGVTYRTRQYIIVDNEFIRKVGYVFTYTAPASVFEAHEDEVATMIEKVRFS